MRMLSLQMYMQRDNTSFLVQIVKQLDFPTFGTTRCYGVEQGTNTGFRETRLARQTVV